MRRFIYIFIVTLFTSSFLFSQEKQPYENPYPKFVPYISGRNLVSEQNIIVDNKDLGKEQPARWLSVDPMADKYPGWSTYNYSLCNPLIYIDPNGDSVEVAYTQIPLFDLMGSKPIYHSLLVLTNEETSKVTTIEGMPEHREMGVLIDLISGKPNSDAWGNLIPKQATLLRDIDPENRETIPTPGGMTDAQFQSSLLNAQEVYGNGSKIQYAPFPEFKKNTANSNSYTYSILNATGTFYIPNRQVPGWFIDIFK